MGWMEHLGSFTRQMTVPLCLQSKIDNKGLHRSDNLFVKQCVTPHSIRANSEASKPKSTAYCDMFMCCCH